LDRGERHIRPLDDGPTGRAAGTREGRTDVEMQMEARSEELGQRGGSCFGDNFSLGRTRMRGRGGNGLTT